jgi:hypothetical protein
MPRSCNPALKQRKGGLYGVSVDVAHGIDTILVLDGLALAENASVVQGFGVSREIIGHNHVNVRRNVLAEVPRQHAALNVAGMEESALAAALTFADDIRSAGVGVIASPCRELGSAQST